LDAPNKPPELGWGLVSSFLGSDGFAPNRLPPCDGLLVFDDDAVAPKRPEEAGLDSYFFSSFFSSFLVSLVVGLAPKRLALVLLEVD
jgi:hypothetical protein